MRRRDFLKLSGITTFSLAALPSLGIVSVSTEEALAGLLVKEFDYLKLDLEGVKTFIKEFTNANPYSMLELIKLRAFYLMDLKIHQSEMVTELAINYIKSTDFFLNRMDESRPVKYLGLYNPYRTPCANPFSTFYIPQEAI